jgi:hypothetical protein
VAQAPPASENKAPAGQQTQVPPDERFWKLYSPHHEFPLSGAGSIAVHVLIVIALLVLASSFWGSRDEANKPVENRVLEIMGGEGLGLDGLGSGTTPLGGTKGQTEVQGPAGGPERPPSKDQVAPGHPKDSLRPKDQLEFPDPKPPPVEDGGGIFSELDKTVRRVETDIAVAMNPPPPKGVVGKVGAGKDYPSKKPGTGGKAGQGTGQGTGVGPGGGTSPYGVVLSKQQRRQKRWRILASPDGPIHLAKLQALNVTLVMPTRNPKVFTVFDLTRKPVQAATTTRLEEHGNKVWWTNRNAAEVKGLASVLGLRETPPCFVIFLPTKLEERMVEIEEAHQGAQEHEIEETVWDIPLRDGYYAREPVIVEQRLKGRAGGPPRR